MNAKYQRYIEYVVNDLEIPYFKNMKEVYGLRPNEYELVLSKLFNQPVTIISDYVYNEQDNTIYYETSDGFWQKWEYDNQGNKIYYGNSNGYWWKKEYNDQGDIIYFEDSDGAWYKNEYDNQGNLIYFEDGSGYIEDRR